MLFDPPPPLFSLVLQHIMASCLPFGDDFRLLLLFFLNNCLLLHEVCLSLFLKFLGFIFLALTLRSEGFPPMSGGP